MAVRGLGVAVLVLAGVLVGVLVSTQSSHHAQSEEMLVLQRRLAQLEAGQPNGRGTKDHIISQKRVNKHVAELA